MKCRKQIEENTLPSMPSSLGDSNSLLTVIAGSYEGQLCGFSVTSVAGSSGASNSTAVIFVGAGTGAASTGAASPGAASFTLASADGGGTIAAGHRVAEP